MRHNISQLIVADKRTPLVKFKTRFTPNLSDLYRTKKNNFLLQLIKFPSHLVQQI